MDEVKVICISDVEVIKKVVAKFAPTPGNRPTFIEPLLLLLHIIPDTPIVPYTNAFMPRTFSVKAWLNDRGCSYIGWITIRLDDVGVFIKNKCIGNVGEFLANTSVINTG